MIARIVFSTFIFAGIFFCVAQPVQAQTSPSEVEYRAVLLELIKTLQLQIQLLQSEMGDRQNVVTPVDYGYSKIIDSDEVTISYSIDHTSDIESIEDSLHKTYFNRVFELFPDEFDSKVRQLVVFGGDDAEYDAFVETLPPSHEFWSYATHQDMLSHVDSDANTELIVHELAHIVSYEEIIGVANAANQVCVGYFKRLGCPSSNSYLKKFIADFWSDDDLERAEDLLLESDYYETAYNYYLEHDTEFVSDYATVAPEEDFAETFAFFVLDIPVAGTIAQRKIDFMKNHSELNLFRLEIRENL